MIAATFSCFDYHKYDGDRLVSIIAPTINISTTVVVTTAKTIPMTLVIAILVAGASLIGT